MEQHTRTHTIKGRTGTGTVTVDLDAFEYLSVIRSADEGESKPDYATVLWRHWDEFEYDPDSGVVRRKNGGR
jgi:hypothetical protein